MKAITLLPLFCIGITIQAQNNFKYLDINNVKAGIGNRGIMHYDPATNQASYEVPRGSGKHSDFFSALWIGGYDNSNALHLAAQTYRQSDDFWPGPLDTTNGGITAATSNQYDKIWKLNKTDIDNFIINFNNGNVQNNSFTPAADLLSWPAQGVGAQSRNLAPFVDVNQNHIYDPLTGGDYPVMKGDQMLYFIFNDNMSHGNSGGLPMKVEVHATAYAYGQSTTSVQNPYLNNATFYHYKIINRSNQSYNNVNVTLWSDADLGYYGDDFIGCDIADNFGYIYNSDSYDETIGGINGYGSFIPAAGYQVLRGPVDSQNGIDDNRNGMVDEPCEQMGMMSFNYFNHLFPGVPVSQTPPSSPLEYYRYMSATWKDGSPLTCGGNGYGGSLFTYFAYPGQYPYCGGNWTEQTAGNSPGNREFNINIGAFMFTAGSSHEIEFVHCTSFPTNNSSAVAELKSDMQSLRAFHQQTYPWNFCIPITSVKEEEQESFFLIYPNPASSEINLRTKSSKPSTIEISDVYGKVLLNLTAQNSEHVNLNISSFAAGVYFVKVITEGKSTVKKFIKH